MLGSLGKYRDKKNRLRFKYAKYYKSTQVDKHLILFESFHGKEISDTPLAMMRALLEMPCAKDYKLYFSSNNIERDKETVEKLGLDAELVHIHSDDYVRLLASAGFLINNSSFPSYFTRRDEQVYLQTWHGTPWKTLGSSMKGELATMHNAQHNFIQASHLLFPNEFTKEAIMRDYLLEDLFTGKVITNGYPRCAVFSDSEKATEIKKLCGDERISTLAYMPTWRGQDNKNIENEEYVKETLDMLRSMDEALGDDQKLYVNLHPIVQSALKLDGFKHVFTFPAGIEKYEFINSVDALITDYSSIFFDYSITVKPIVLFTYDYNNYVSERGMYFGIEELPFKRVDTLEEMCELLESKGYEGLSYADDAEYREKFIKYDSKDSASELMMYMLSEIGRSDITKPKLKTEDYSGNSQKPRRVLDCRIIGSRLDIDSLMREKKEGDLYVFHQSKFEEKIGERFKELYDGSFPYIFTTEAMPETMGEALSFSKRTKERVKERNTRRWIGEIPVTELVENKMLRIDVESIKTRGEEFRIKMKAPVEIGKITGIRFEYRSEIEEIVYELDFDVISRDDSIIITTSIDTSVIRDGCIYWDLFITAEKDGRSDDYQAMLKRAIGAELKCRVCQCENGDYITFPHMAMYRALAFTHRELTPYDNRKTRFAEIAAFSAAIAFGRFFRKKKIWLVYEKFCSAAQDNGYYFFKYCMENLSAEEKKHIYYVIDKRFSDYENVKKYGNNVVQFMSFKHMLYCLVAKVYVGSDSKKHLYIWRPKPNLISGRMRNKPVHFLQHGVTALKRTDVIFGAKGTSPMTHITTTSEYEQRIMDEFWGYSPANAPILGFTRWDVLEDKSDPNEKLILVMPTWRAWLEEKPEEEFISSEYFMTYKAMLEDTSLREVLEKNKVKLIFFIHPKLKDYLGQFGASSDQVELVQFGTKPLNDIMMKCNMLVTDYSSVCWDVYYMGKPVVFYQFDYDMYMENHGSYLDMENELFGDRYTKLEDVIESIKRNIQNDFKESERAVSMRDKYFKYIDSDNSKRTYEYLKKKGY